MVEDITGHDEVQVILVWGIPHVMALERRKHIQKSHINGQHLWFKKIQEGKNTLQVAIVQVNMYGKQYNK